MTAHIVDLAQARLARSTPSARFRPQPRIVGAEMVKALRPCLGAFNQPAHGLVSKAPFQFWTGASGTRYVHTIYSLFDCPPVETANYILVKRHLDGHRTVLSIGRAHKTAPTLNLAEIRRRSAELGANEVHVHLLAGSSVQCCAIEADLRQSLVIA